LEKTIMGRRFNPDRYGMIHCPVCKGSGKLLNGIQGNKAFSNLDELWEILNPLKAESPKTKKRNKFYVTGIHPRKRKNKPKNLLAPERGRGLR